MRLTLRIVASLVLTATVVVAGSTFLQARAERLRLTEDLRRRSAVLAETLEDSVAPALQAGDKTRLARISSKYADRGRLVGLAVFSKSGAPLVLSRTITLAGEPFKTQLVERALALGVDEALFRGGRHYFASPIESEDGPLGALLLVHDASFIEARIGDVWRHNYFRLLTHAVLICLVSLLIVRWNVTGPMEQLAHWMRQLRAGGEPPVFTSSERLFEPVAAEAASLAKLLADARASAEQEAALRQKGAAIWTPERLKARVQDALQGGALFVAANREPYMHVRRGQKIEVLKPASGLVTGLEPILRACGGLWVAHGSGDADRETADASGRLRVPVGDPRYTLKRVWLTKDQEEGYYYGFANEGLWPLCHIAHARPIFKASDWQHYERVNRLFADSLLEEMDGVANPHVLIQDYHFALLPAMIKEARPDARVAAFWHIPWPNPEAFGICPWQREILEGLLGADLLGFHTQFHCNNFLETVDRTLESRIDWERFAVQRRGRTTSVKPFPISVAPPDLSAPATPKSELLKRLGVSAELLGVGVDRVDYTKGILERFWGIERFLTKHPEYQGRFTFVQIGAPSRTHIQRYRDLFKQVEAEADRINWAFKPKSSASNYRPIVLLNEHHDHDKILPYYRAADVCLVTSLHDGMNLVAKEFAASRDDERGTLILSRFTGAARELRDALIVNPYDFEQLSDALRYALEMPEDEQRRRMAGMRRVVHEHNVYAWAASLIDALVSVRPGARDLLRSLP